MPGGRGRVAGRCCTLRCGWGRCLNSPRDREPLFNFINSFVSFQKRLARRMKTDSKAMKGVDIEHIELKEEDDEDASGGEGQQVLPHVVPRREPYITAAFFAVTALYVFYRSQGSPTFCSPTCDPFSLSLNDFWGLLFVATFLATGKRFYLVYAINPLRNLVLVALQAAIPELAVSSPLAEFQRDIVSAFLQLGLGLCIVFALPSRPISLYQLGEVPASWFFREGWFSLDSIVRIKERERERERERGGMTSLRDSFFRLTLSCPTLRTRQGLGFTGLFAIAGLVLFGISLDKHTAHFTTWGACVLSEARAREREGSLVYSNWTTK